MTTRRPSPFRSAAALAAACLAAWLGACGDRLAAGGDATETGNARVTGTVLEEDGSGAAGAEVSILPAGFSPLGGAAVPDSLKTTADSEGRFRTGRLAPGAYNVHVRHGRKRLSVWGVDLGRDSVRVPTDTVRDPGALTVPLPETRDSGAGWIYVPGSTLRARIDSELRLAGRVLLDSVPAGEVPRIEYAKSRETSPLLLAAQVSVPAGGTVGVDAFATWPHTRNLLLNTADGPAALASDLHGFPLLVRLSAPGFDFSQAAADGSDLRFSSADGAPLAHEIELWDAQSGRAAIWVRLDTLRGGSAGQRIRMHWGASPAAGPLRPGRVFDRAAGFAGVWHLGEEAADTVAAGLYRDATGAGSDGNDRIASASREGVVGFGHGLDSGDYVLAPQVGPQLGLKDEFTLTAWFRTDGKRLGYYGGDLISVGDNLGLRVRPDSSLHVWFWPAEPPAGLETDWYPLTARDSAVFDGRWHLAVATFRDSTLRMYCDGKALGSAEAPDAAGLQFPLNATLGKHGNGKRGHEFDGHLDEAQVHSVARDSDWVRIAYENQKADSEFPAFEPDEP